jgi:flagellar motility protein MotE (MotC chaperone)
MTSVTIDGDEVPKAPDVPDVLDERHQNSSKRLAQLVIAWQKAAEIKKRRSAPKKELKKLEDDIKERLYQEETERVKKLRDLHDNALNTLSAAPAPAVAKNSSSFERRCSHLDDLVKELYLYT